MTTSYDTWSTTTFYLTTTTSQRL